MIASKDKLEILSNNQYPGWKDKHLPSLDCGIAGNGTGYRSDSITVVNTMNIMNEYHPSMVFINLRQPDFNGHTGNWDEYINGVRQSDEDSYQIWNFIKTHPFYKGNTAFFITNDHGRHIAPGPFHSHGDGCEGCRRILLYAYGPDFGENKIVEEPYEQIDISATIAEILQFKMPTSDGEVIQPLFKN